MTTLQELRLFISNGLDTFDEGVKVSEIWVKINELIEEERIQIERAFLEGKFNGGNRLGNDSEEYYSKISKIKL